MWQAWTAVILVGTALAGCVADGGQAPFWDDSARRPVWRRVSPDPPGPLPRYPAPEFSGRA